MDYIAEEIFKDKTPDSKALLLHGFKRKGGAFVREYEILGGQFVLSVKISTDVSTKLTEEEFGDEYTLHLVPNATGDFVGKIRDAYKKILSEIAEECFERNAFKCEQTKKIISHISKKYGDEPQFLWEKYSDCAVFRRKSSGKWYGVLLTVGKDKLIPGSCGKVKIIDLRIDPSSPAAKEKKYLPGYHMNKSRWITVILDGSVSTREIYRLIDASYELADAKTSARRQR